MPPVLPPNNQWLANTLGGQKSAVAALSAQQTQYIIDGAGICQAILGHLQFDQNGTATGIGDKWGIASHKTGSWVQL